MDEYFIIEKLKGFPIKYVLNLEVCVKVCIEMIDYTTKTTHYLDICRDENKKAFIDYDGLYYEIEPEGCVSLGQIFHTIDLNVETINCDYLKQTIDKINNLELIIVLNKMGKIS